MKNRHDLEARKLFSALSVLGLTRSEASVLAECSPKSISDAIERYNITWRTPRMNGHRSKRTREQMINEIKEHHKWLEV